MATYREKRGTNTVPIVSGEPTGGVNGEIVYITGEGLASYNDGTWAKLTATAPAETFGGTFLARDNGLTRTYFAQLGRAAAIGGGNIIAGEHNWSDGSGSNNINYGAGYGRAHIFNASNGTFVRTLGQGMLYPGGSYTYGGSTYYHGTLFGTSVAITPDGTNCFVGETGWRASAVASSTAGAVGRVRQYTVSSGAHVRDYNAPTDTDVGGHYPDGDWGYYEGICCSNSQVLISRENFQINASKRYGGKVYCYNISDGSLAWSVENPNAVSSEEDNDYFGEAIAADPSGNYFAVTARGEDTTYSGYEHAGHLYILNASDGSVAQSIANPNRGSQGHTPYFGAKGAVDISETHVIVGAFYYGANRSGRAFLFKISDGSLVREIASPATTSYFEFGRYTGITKNFYAIAAPGASPASGDMQGKIYVYNLSDGSLAHTLTCVDDHSSSSGQELGYSAMSMGANGLAVSIVSGSRLQGTTGVGNYTGQIQIFN